VLIVSISYGRAGRVKTRDLFPNVILAVVESQYDEYVEKNGGEIMKLPESCAGSIPRTRNYVLDQAKGDEWVAILDDDISEIGRFGGATGERHHVPMTQEEVLTLMAHGSLMADELGTGLWGINLQNDPKFFREYTPLSLSAPVLGPFSVHKASAGIRYENRFWLKEDYDLYLQHLHRFHKVLRFNAFYYLADHKDNSGGAVSFRTYDEEVRQNLMLQAKWGAHVVQIRNEKSLDPKITPPIPGV
jgi:hypothetical protein